MKRMNLALQDDLAAQLQLRAAQAGVSATQITQTALRQYLEEPEKNGVYQLLQMMTSQNRKIEQCLTKLCE